MHKSRRSTRSEVRSPEVRRPGRSSFGPESGNPSRAKKYEAARQRPSQAATLPETRLLAGMEQQWQSTAGRRARTRYNLEHRILHYARDPVPGQTEARSEEHTS